MRIDGPNNRTDFLNLPGGDGKSSKAATSDPKALAVDSGLEHISSQQSLIQDALAASEVNSKAVEEARKMLESGQLDTPEAIKRAAKNMIDLGL